MKNSDSNKPTNTNLFDDLKRTVSGGTRNEELNFNNVNMKIGFKRKNNETITSEENKKANQSEEQKVFNKKAKK